jgi:60 kDa SS-A/Ro ribonucleoprotein
MMALLPNMKMTALIRQLGRLSAIGLGAGEAKKLIIQKLCDAEAIRAERVHPITLLQASKQYAVGHGERGSLSWSASRKIIDALDDAFYASFANVEDTGAGYMLALDVSGSMSWEYSKVNGSPNLFARDVAAVMALAIAKAQSNYLITAFSGRDQIQELKINPSMRLSDVLAVTSRLPACGTDCAGPMMYALKRQLNGIDLFTVITDNETYAGHIQPSQAVRDYRNKYNCTAKLAVIATSTSKFTIADPKDSGMLDIAGFDSAAPQILADFAMLGRR